MCRPNERTHKHHIIPRYVGGTDTPENIVEVTVTQHSMFHFCNYQLWGNEEDRLAWRALSGQITFDEAALEAMVLGGKKGGNKNKENKTGICGLSPEERCKNGRKGGKISGNKHKENKTGICGRSPEKMSEDGKKGGNKTKENKTGIFGRSPEKMSEDGKKGGNKTKENKTRIFGLSLEEVVENCRKGGNKTKENKTGVCGQSPEKMRENGRKGGKIGGKIASSQKWQCTETGYVSNSGGLTIYQKTKGIDVSKRIKVDGPKIWEITFEDGKVIVTYQTLKDWAKENGCSYYGLLEVRKGKNRSHNGIIKIICL